MADRVPATISLGGVLSRADVTDLLEAIAADGLSAQWDVTACEIETFRFDRPLTLAAHAAASGRFPNIEACCRRLGLTYVRWAGGSPDCYPPSREVFLGAGQPEDFLVSEDDELLLSLAQVRALGSLQAVEAHAARALCQVPDLVLAPPRGASNGGVPR